MADECVNYSFKLQEFQYANESLKGMFSEVLQLPPVTKCINQHTNFNLETLNKLEEDIAEAKIAYSASHEKAERLQKEYDTLKKEADEKTMYNKLMLRQKADLEKEYNLLSKSKLSNQDQQLLESTKLRYKALRNMTQVKFAFEKSDRNRLEGFAFNTVNNKVKCFSISNCSMLGEDKIMDQIIACMSEVDGTNFADLE